MSIQAPLYNLKGEVAGKMTLPESVFGATISDALMAQAVRVALARARQNTKKAKTRSEVNRTTAKVWRQKGTGRARHGSRRAPIFVGGGVAHGPTGNENYDLKLTQKMRQAALKGALTNHVQQKTLVCIDEIDKLEPKTKALSALFEKMSLLPKYAHILLILDTPHQNVLHAAKNITAISTSQVKRLNAYEVLRPDFVVMTAKAVEMLKKA